MRSKRRLVVGTLVVLGITLAGVGAGWWQYVNQVPVITARSVTLPSPNAYDDYLAATNLIATGRNPRVWDAAKMLPAERDGLVDANREALDRLRDGLQYQFRNPPFDPVTQSYPNMKGFDTLSRLLIIEGKQAEAEGRVQDAAESYLDCLQLGVDLPKGGAFVHGLTGLTSQERGLQALQELSPRLNDRTVLPVLSAMRDLNQTAPAVGELIASERELSGQYFAHLLRTTPPTQLTAIAGFSQSPGMLVEYFLTPKRRILTDYEGYMEAWIAHSKLPVYGPAPVPVLPRNSLCRHLVPPINESVWKRWALRDAQWRVTETGLAIRAYEAAHRKPPATLAQLVPKYLRAVPEDPYAAQPLALRRKEGKTIVYSRGPDGDDDLAFQGSRKTASGDGDVVLVQSHR
ncbi:MAG: type secretion system protein (GspG) [Armatimonadetes bacterium]|nr:type secretion system protein (GspG) [Armatimonadota bacterium]